MFKIKATNITALLFRTRKALRECLEKQGLAMNDMEKLIEDCWHPDQFERHRTLERAQVERFPSRMAIR